jgi:hypothetical protein
MQTTRKGRSQSSFCNLQLQRQRCDRLERFFKVEENSSSWATRSDVIHGRRTIVGIMQMLRHVLRNASDVTFSDKKLFCSSLQQRWRCT